MVDCEPLTARCSRSRPPISIRTNMSQSRQSRPKWPKNGDSGSSVRNALRRLSLSGNGESIASKRARASGWTYNEVDGTGREVCPKLPLRILWIVNGCNSGSCCEIYVQMFAAAGAARRWTPSIADSDEDVRRFDTSDKELNARFEAVKASIDAINRSLDSWTGSLNILKWMGATCLPLMAGAVITNLIRHWN